jgi:hypothetical protein
VPTGAADRRVNGPAGDGRDLPDETNEDPDIWKDCTRIVVASGVLYRDHQNNTERITDVEMFE